MAQELSQTGLVPVTEWSGAAGEAVLLLREVKQLHNASGIPVCAAFGFNKPLCLGDAGRTAAPI
jgi:hypothetical protein